ncbi:hypothetical protein F5050DRAFT_1709977 [Lentinula boryana]|uniref:Uncharacterized protein n=1 Tax=Lentinula boryana TaxID=40481 RepID=A0ABQ8QL01_9AGAR|nr:hypothetical protein F5050DRAFT_1709977 [Lentinula boryana]
MASRQESNYQETKDFLRSHRNIRLARLGYNCLELHEGIWYQFVANLAQDAATKAHFYLMVATSPRRHLVYGQLRLLVGCDAERLEMALQRVVSFLQNLALYLAVNRLNQAINNQAKDLLDDLKETIVLRLDNHPPSVVITFVCPPEYTSFSKEVVSCCNVFPFVNILVLDVEEDDHFLDLIISEPIKFATAGNLESVLNESLDAGDEGVMGMMSRKWMIRTMEVIMKIMMVMQKQMTTRIRTSPAMTWGLTTEKSGYFVILLSGTIAAERI